jgi:hypothetical protein
MDKYHLEIDAKRAFTDIRRRDAVPYAELKTSTRFVYPFQSDFNAVLTRINAVLTRINAVLTRINAVLTRINAVLTRINAVLTLIQVPYEELKKRFVYLALR